MMARWIYSTGTVGFTTEPVQGSLPASREETKEKAKSKPKWTRETCIQAIFLCPSSITCLFISAVGYSPNSLGSEVRRPVFEQLSHLVWL